MPEPTARSSTYSPVTDPELGRSIGTLGRLVNLWRNLLNAKRGSVTLDLTAGRRTTLRFGIVLLAILSEVLLVSCKKSDSWTDFTSDEGNFAVRFPKPATESEKRDHDERTVHVVINESVVYIVSYGWINAQRSTPPNEADFRRFKDEFFESLGKCSTVSEGAASPALQDYMGRHYIVHCPNDAGIEVTHSTNLYLDRSRYYSVAVLSPTSDPEPPDSAKFLGSFHLLNPAR